MQRHLVVAEQELARYWGIAARGADRYVAPAVRTTRDHAVGIAARFGNRALRRALIFGAGVTLATMPGNEYGLPSWDLPDNFWGGIFGFILGGFEWVWDRIREAVTFAVHWLLQRLNGLMAILQPLWDSAFGTLTWLIEKTNELGQKIKDAADKVKDDIAGAIDHVLGIVNGLISTAITAVYDTLGPIVEGVVRTVLNGFESLFFTLLNGVRDIATAIAMELRDLVWPAISELKDQLLHMAGFGWDAFWGLFWPLLGQQLGIPEDPLDVLRGAWWLLRLAAEFASGDFQAAMEEFARGSFDYATREVADMARDQWDLLEPIIRAAVGLTS